MQCLPATILVRRLPIISQNRDPSSFKCFTPLEAEERRRLWTILLSLDWLDNSGRTYLCSPVQCDTLVRYPPLSSFINH